MGEKYKGQLELEGEDFQGIVTGKKPEEKYFFVDGELVEAQTPAQQKVLQEDVRNRRIKGWREANEQLKRDHPSWGETKN